MKRVCIGNGIYTCWSCGSINVMAVQDDDSTEYPYRVVCEDCGVSTLNAPTEEKAKQAWSRAYAVSMA